MASCGYTNVTVRMSFPHMSLLFKLLQGGDPAHFKRILTAYEVLSDAKKVRKCHA